MSIGHNIKIRRAIVDITQKELSDRTGINQALISRIERGGMTPDLEHLRKIAKALGCSVVDLLDEQDKKTSRRGPYVKTGDELETT